MDRPLLALDRPFTYALDEELSAALGSLVQVPFHRRPVRGWVLGPTDDLPARMLRVRKVVSPVRFFDQDMLSLLKWMSERYVAPLASVIARSVPPRVASEEHGVESSNGALGPAGPGRLLKHPRFASLAAELATDPAPPAFAPLRPPLDPPLLPGYLGGTELREAVSAGSGSFVVRPAPEHEQALAVEAVRATLGSGRTAVVLVPEAEPVPATARALLDAFGESVALFLGGDRRERYRMWLDIRAGRYRCVVGTRPAVFAPLAGLGLIWVSRESHPGHREERSPYYHVRDVALARARLQGAVAVMTALCPSLEALAGGHPAVVPPGRAWPPVEVVRPEPEGRAPRLMAALRQARIARTGYEPHPAVGHGEGPKVVDIPGRPRRLVGCRVDEGCLGLGRGVRIPARTEPDPGWVGRYPDPTGVQVNAPKDVTAGRVELEQRSNACLPVPTALRQQSPDRVASCGHVVRRCSHRDAIGAVQKRWRNRKWLSRRRNPWVSSRSRPTILRTAIEVLS